jgi:hypothetical protein
LPLDFHDGGLDRDQQDEPGGAIDRERATADGRNLDGSAQEVARSNGCVRDDVRLNYRFERLPALSQKLVERACGQLA